MRVLSPALMRMFMFSGPYWWNLINLKLHQEMKHFKNIYKMIKSPFSINMY